MTTDLKHDSSSAYRIGGEKLLSVCEQTCTLSRPSRTWVSRSTPYPRIEGGTRGHRLWILDWCLSKQWVVWWHRRIWLADAPSSVERMTASSCHAGRWGGGHRTPSCWEPNLIIPSALNSLTEADFLCKRLLTLLITPPPPRYLIYWAVKKYLPFQQVCPNRSSNVV